MILRDRLEKALVRGHENDLDHLLYNERDHIDDLKALRDAAVLIAVTDRPDPGVIFVQRPQHMRNHPGQVAFPAARSTPATATRSMRRCARRTRKSRWSAARLTSSA